MIDANDVVSSHGISVCRLGCAKLIVVLCSSIVCLLSIKFQFLFKSWGTYDIFTIRDKGKLITNSSSMIFELKIFHIQIRRNIIRPYY